MTKNHAGEFFDKRLIGGVDMVPTWVVEKYSQEDGQSPCPFCGGTPEWVEVPGEDFILRCSDCHASTKIAQMDYLEAIKDWNSGDIEDDHFSVAMDTRIDDYLANGIVEVRFSPFDFLSTKYSQAEPGQLFDEAVIVTPDTMLLLDQCGSFLEYDTYGGFNPEVFNTPITCTKEPITFVRSEWDEDKLRSIVFHCGNRQIVVAADAGIHRIVIR